MRFLATAILTCEISSKPRLLTSGTIKHSQRVYPMSYANLLRILRADTLFIYSWSS